APYMVSPFPFALSLRAQRSNRSILQYRQDCFGPLGLAMTFALLSHGSFDHALDTQDSHLAVSALLT
ncbi:MAG: hypothetical protein WBC89_07905, partial [Dehalococcoidia bacterium]